MVRNPAKLSRPVRAVTADLAAPDLVALESAVTGTDAVLSALGPHSNADAGIASQGTPAIVAAMKAGRNLKGGTSVPRADVAHFMLSVISQPETIHQAIGIAS